MRKVLYPDGVMRPESDARHWEDDVLFPKENPILAKWVKWASACNTCYQPECTLGAVLAVASSIMGQMYTVSSNFCNLYVVSLMETASGKDACLRSMRTMLAAIGRDSLIGASNFSSGPGVLGELEAKGGRVLWCVDEMAPDLRTLAAGVSISHKEEILSYMLEMYTIKPFSKKLAKAQVTITDPCPIIYAGCQPVAWWQSTSIPKLLEGGFSNRFLVVNGDNFARSLTYLNAPLPDADVVAHLKAFDSSDYAPGTPNHLEGIRRVIELTPEAMEIHEEENNKVQTFILDARKTGDVMPKQLIGRDAFKTLRIAAVYAWIKDYNNPIIDADAIQWAWKITNESARMILDQCRLHLQSTPTEADVNLLLRQVKMAGINGIEIKELRARCRSFATRFDAIYSHAMTTGEIITKTFATANLNKSELRVIAKENKDVA